MSDMFEPFELPKPKGQVNFNFTLSHLEDHGKPIADQRNAVGNRISSLLERFSSETETPPGLIESLLNYFKRNGAYDVKSIVILGRILVLLGQECLTQFDELDEKVKMINYAAKNPDFMALVFGSFDTAAEDFLKDILTSTADQDSAVFD